jgi:hypothetical protein
VGTPDPIGTKDDSKDSGKATRWWERYYVRYFVGTVLGVVIIFVLREKAALHCDFEQIIPPLKEATGWQLSAITAAGLAYCYIASAPVLTLHAIRGGLNLAALNSHMLLGIFLVVFAGIPFGAWGLSHWFRSGSAFGLTLAGALVFVQLVLVAIAQRKDFGKVNNFYDDLVKARYEEAKAGTDYKDSYRHMREHGNAMMIVILEILLGAVLATIEKAPALVVVLVVWLIPAAYVWVIGSTLEGHFVKIGGKVLPQASLQVPTQVPPP